MYALFRYFETRRNGQLPKSQLTIKSTCQRSKPEHFGHFMLGLTFRQDDILEVDHIC
jgi:hypothetical protein